MGFGTVMLWAGPLDGQALYQHGAASLQTKYGCYGTMLQSSLLICATEINQKAAPFTALLMYFGSKMRGESLRPW